MGGRSLSQRRPLVRLGVIDLKSSSVFNTKKLRFSWDPSRVKACIQSWFPGRATQGIMVIFKQWPIVFRFVMQFRTTQTMWGYKDTMIDHIAQSFVIQFERWKRSAGPAQTQWSYNSTTRGTRPTKMLWKYNSKMIGPIAQNFVIQYDWWKRSLRRMRIRSGFQGWVSLKIGETIYQRKNTLLREPPWTIRLLSIDFKGLGFF